MTEEETEVGSRYLTTITYHPNKNHRMATKCLYIAGDLPYDFWEWTPDFWFVVDGDYWWFNNIDARRIKD